MGINSRALSVGRAGSLARTIAKRREKPYKTEHSRVLTKKRKLNLHTTYNSAPTGFRFLPVGTPDLAERCKELSRLRGLPVNVVNAKPVSKHAVDPEKVSHHIHRIGYHFRSDIVDDACRELGYAYNHGVLVKEADIQAQHERSKMARALAKYGMQLDESTRQETDEQVRAAIKELFPKIPEEDLKEILHHAWEEGTNRVGTNARIELPRRVQLATIARIRHTYTDYDRLLRAFEWKDARALVEPTCLAKLIEWRGENEDNNEDNELEEIVRETIIIDDDDDDDDGLRRNNSETDDSGDLGYASEMSVEISHRPAADDDLGAESHDERSKKLFYRFQPPHRSIQQRYMDVSQKIGTVRAQLRDGTFLASAPQPYVIIGTGAGDWLMVSRDVVRVHMPDHGDGMVRVNGQMFCRDSARVGTPTATFPYQRLPQSNVYGFQNGHASPSRMTQPYRLPTNFAEDHIIQQDRPVASIEGGDDLLRVAALPTYVVNDDRRHNGHHSHPVTPDVERFEKRRRLNYAASQDCATIRQSHAQRKMPTSVGVSRVTSSHDHVKNLAGHASMDSGAYSHPGISPADGPGAPLQIAPPAQTQIPGGTLLRDSAHGMSRDPQTAAQAVGTFQFDPPNQALPVSSRGEHLSGRASPREQDYRQGFVNAQVAPVQYMPLVQTSRSSPHSRPPVYEVRDRARAYTSSQQPQVVYVRRAPAPQLRTGYTPQPVHGAPAAVQQVPRFAEPVAQSHAGVSYLPPPGVSQQPPTEYPPQQQYYYPR